MTNTPNHRLQQLQRRYLAALHAMQSGIAQMMHIDPTDTTPKHLRAGINSAHVTSSALAKLLIEKGVITEEEWLTALAEGAEAEQARYEAELSERMGVKITLG